MGGVQAEGALEAELVGEDVLGETGVDGAGGAVISAVDGDESP